MNSERELFEEWFCDNHTGLKPSELIKFRLDNGYSFKDSIKIDCMWEAWQASTQRQGYKLVPENEINIMDMIHGKCPCGSSRSPIISDKEGYNLIHCFACGANKYIHKDY